MSGDAARRRAETQRRLDEDIRREKAAALGRAGERLEEALRETAEIGRHLDATVDGARRRELADAYETARQRAQAARFALVIQREAIGLRHHRDLERVFPEPPRRRRDP